MPKKVKYFPKFNYLLPTSQHIFSNGHTNFQAGSGSGSWLRIWIRDILLLFEGTDPDPGGPKTYES